MKDQTMPRLPRAKRIKLSPARRFITDLCWLGRGTPLAVIRGTIDASAIVSARKASGRAAPLSAIVVKALALTAQEMPELRRCYLPLLWPRMIEMPVSIAMIMVDHRSADGERMAFPLRLHDPARQRIRDIGQRIEAVRNAPAESAPRMRGRMILSRLPLLLRRLIWLIAYNTARLRQDEFGNIAVSSVGQIGRAVGGHIDLTLSPTTLLMTYGPIAPDGRLEVSFLADHRVMDGAVVAQALRRFADILATEMVAEIGAEGVV